MNEYKGHVPEWEWDVEHGEFFGHVVGIRDVITFRGKTMAQLEASFRESVDACLEGIDESRIRPRGSFRSGALMPLSPDLYRAAWEAAKREGMDVRDWMIRAVEEAVTRAGQPSVEAPKRTTHRRAS